MSLLSQIFAFLTPLPALIAAILCAFALTAHSGDNANNEEGDTPEALPQVAPEFESEPTQQD